MAALFRFLLPSGVFSRAMRIVCWAWVGILAGLGVFVLHISRAPSYLSNAPETCINCHVMTDAYVSWQHSSHAHVAVCNDCHVPQDNVLRSYSFKARDGLWHATVFTLRWEPQVIRLSERARPVVQANCRRCHQELLREVCSVGFSSSGEGAGPCGQGDRLCWDCHRETPHGPAHSLAGVPDVFRPRLPGPLRWNQTPTITDRPVQGGPRLLTPPQENP